MFIQLHEKANNWGIPVHMDGARLLNAAVALNLEPKEILRYVDSVSVCLSKVCSLDCMCTQSDIHTPQMVSINCVLVYLNTSSTVLKLDI